MDNPELEKLGLRALLKPPSDSGVEGEVLHILVEQYYAANVRQTVTQLLTTPLFGVAFYLHYRSFEIAAWIGIAMAAYALRWALNRQYWTSARRKEDASRWERQAFLTTFLTGGSYAAAPFVILHAGQDGYNAVGMFWMLSVIAAGAPVCAVLRRSLVVFCGLVGMGLIVAVAMLPGAIHKVAAIGFAGSTLLFLTYGVKSYQVQVSALTLGISNRRLAGELQAQVEASEKANQEKIRFIAAASHDLRQPLHAMNLFGDVLARRLDGTIHQQDFQHLMHSVHALNTSLNALLDISKLQSGTVRPRIAPVLLGDVFAALRLTFAEAADRKRISLRFHAPPIAVQADEHLLGRILGNLIDNAIKFTPNGGSVLVAARLRRRSAPGEAVVEVRDSGIGIPPEHQQQVFDEFFQLAQEGVPRAQGLGMGLSIVRRLAQLQGIGLQMASDRGRGTRFTVRLKLATDGSAALPAERAALPARTGTQRSWKGLRVLVVDDDPSIGHAVQQFLASHGMSAFVAISIADAVAAVKDAPRLDVAILDKQLPDQASVAESIQTLHAVAGRSFPVIVVTGDALPSEIGKLQQAGLSVCFKPLTADALLRALSNALDRSGA